MRNRFSAIALAAQLSAGFGVISSAFAQDLAKLCGEFPQPVVRIKPLYPEAGVDQRITGYVTVEFTVGKTGVVQGIAVIDSSDGLFEDAAIQAVSKWKYFPCAVGAKIAETIEFTAENLDEALTKSD